MISDMERHLNSFSCSHQQMLLDIERARMTAEDRRSALLYSYNKQEAAERSLQTARNKQEAAKHSLQAALSQAVRAGVDTDNQSAYNTAANLGIAMRTLYWEDGGHQTFQPTVTPAGLQTFYPQVDPVQD